MSISLHEAAVASIDQRLAGLDTLLKKAWDEAQGRKFDESVLLHTRLIPDMFPLVRQIQLVCDFAKNPAARVAGVEPPKMADEEKTFAELHARIAKTREYLASLKPEQFNGRENADITFPVGPDATMTLPADKYVLGFAHPNFYFHLTTAYNILRKAGINIGKRDYFGGF